MSNNNLDISMIIGASSPKALKPRKAARNNGEAPRVDRDQKMSMCSVSVRRSGPQIMICKITELRH